MKSSIAKFLGDKRSFSTRREKENNKLLKTPKEKLPATKKLVKTISPSESSNTQMHEGLLNCNICLDTYNDNTKKPKILPYCGHTLCQECLLALINCNKGNKNLVCHLCKKENPLFPNMTVDKYPNNWIIIDILKNTIDVSEFVSSSKPQPNANICKACNKNDVSHFCRLHFIKYCAYCALKHMKECRPEKMVELNEVDSLCGKIIAQTNELEKQVTERLLKVDEYKANIESKVEEKFEDILKLLGEKRKNTLAALDYHQFQLSSLKDEAKLIVSDLNGLHSPLTEMANTTDINSLKKAAKAINTAEEYIKVNKERIDDQPNIKVMFNDEMLLALENSIKGMCWIELQNGPNKEQFNSSTLIFSACEKGNIKIVDFILKNFIIDIEKKDKNGYTPAFLALVSKQINLFKFLREQYKANINVQDNTGKTPLIFAVMTENDSLVEYLLVKCQALPNLQTIWKDTALHFAVQSNNLRIAKLLLDFHSDTTITNGDGKIPVQLCKGDTMKALLKPL